MRFFKNLLCFWFGRLFLFSVKGSLYAAKLWRFFLAVPEAFFNRLLFFFCCCSTLHFLHKSTTIIQTTVVKVYPWLIFPAMRRAGLGHSHPCGPSSAPARQEEQGILRKQSWPHISTESNRGEPWLPSRNILCVPSHLPGGRFEEGLAPAPMEAHQEAAVIHKIVQPLGSKNHTPDRGSNPKDTA